MKPEEFDVEKDRAEWESFMPALMHILAATSGPVLEVGVGHYSTPVLHAFCADTKRTLYSVEEDLDWAVSFASKYGTRGHQFLCGSYDELLGQLLRQTWSVVFLDHSPGPRRGADMMLFIDHAEYIVIHDYHLAIEEAVAPLLAGLNYHVVKEKPPTLIVSGKLPIPASILAL